MSNHVTLRFHLFAFLAGLLTVFGFAPYEIFVAPIVGLTILFYLWHGSATVKNNFKLGFSFGLGLYGFGIYWIYISLHEFGGMPWWFAGFCTFCLCAFMALFPALVGYFSKRIGWTLWTVPLLWGVSDWVRSWIFTGFPWLTLGYSQVPSSPLVGFMPMIGVYGVSIIVALIASLIAYGITQHTHLRWRLKVAAAISMIIISGQLLSFVEWTTPFGEPLKVALLQGNVSQTIKWSPDVASSTINQYLQMVEQSDAQLIVLPETALPVIAQQLDKTVIQRITQHAQQQQGDALVGLVQYDAENQSYFNSALSFGSAPVQAYSKSHLVPFGEFIPLKAIFGWIYQDWLNIPLSDLSRGQNHTPMQLAGQQVAVNICYEDVFGEEIIRPLPAATLLVNMSNDAWYGKSFAAVQHMQFSQARAIETGRMMLRSTNTGATAIINQHGIVQSHAPHDAQITLTGMVQGYQGSTPYIWWGNRLFIVFSFGFLAWFMLKKYQHKGTESPKKA
ncbi:MAG: apolipoprotein N-acyltransferase [Methylophilales bacterium 28-44-11]|jgi:apolipoprotein N-acyltransferase|nr:MAG: apolipoprotein N-acyltransferase [Methylophilales bacterium 28-44-11]OYY99742.1 MAG: apolipoprotein N-acyltransferase [Methylophilales bacterium 16-45-7]